MGAYVPRQPPSQSSHSTRLPAAAMTTPAIVPPASNTTGARTIKATADQAPISRALFRLSSNNAALAAHTGAPNRASPAPSATVAVSGEVVSQDPNAASANATKIRAANRILRCGSARDAFGSARSPCLTISLKTISQPSSQESTMTA